MDMASDTLIENVPKLVASGKITPSQLDDAVRPILEMKIRLGLFEHPFVDETKVDAVLNRQSSRELERKLAARSMVLLRNQNHTLPLTRSLKKVALIGPLADSVEDMEGGWTVEGLFGGEPKSHVVTIAEGMKNKLEPIRRSRWSAGRGCGATIRRSLTTCSARSRIPCPRQPMWRSQSTKR